MAVTTTHPYGRLGVVRARRVLLHDSTGVTPMDLGPLLDACTGMPFPTCEDEFDACDAAMGLGEDALWASADAIVDCEYQDELAAAWSLVAAEHQLISPETIIAHDGSVH